ncbi:amino acid transporter [Paucilactobacillus oligofermentans DSM 15707 = LMG 22743]|uniref:Amino acid transporter n=1 Tax=Paucilactobacillus oligofermentans DSM 15707 = LMG 22743 TaxID=1423778 RepID=A0A0R1RMC0_9LACO|nr:amino acid permease [Paucilactobacillus oligofermentans]KRL55738.1 amino acid transporter [Paucilactobacillus oligofermentans DSM 15707 = LMG 22743]CUS27040.1 Amino acid permease family protein [Paucilactobacillus oligofermentans DSM 15707 = LMG 22743]
MKEDIELKRSLGLWSALALVVGTVIGSGIFFKQGSVLDSAGSSTMALLAWVVGGVITLTAGLTIAEIGAQLPYTGGLYIYMEKIYGRVLGFLSGWMQIIVYGPAIIASLAGYLALLLVNFFGLGEAWLIPLAIFSMILIGGLNMLDNRLGAAFAIITTLAKLLPIAAIIIFGIFYGHQGAIGQTITQVHQSSGTFGVAVLATLFGYDGWILIANLGGEIKNPQRILPRAIVMGLVFVLVVYTAVTFGVFNAIPAKMVSKLGDNTTIYLAQQAFGTIGGRLLNIGVIISIMGCMNGKIMTFPRIMYAMAKRNDLPFSKQLAYLNPKTHAPMISTVVILVIAALMVTFSNADYLSNLCIFTVYCFYIAAFIGVFILRRREHGNERPFSTPLYPLTPIIAIAGALFVTISQIFNDPLGSFVSLGIVAVGLPVFYLVKKYTNQSNEI